MWVPALLGLLSPPGGDRPRRTNLDETQLIQLAVTGAPLPTWGLPKEYSQRVDHFSKKEPPDAFAQRYFESDAHFDEANGAVVLYISGEAPLYAAPGSDTYTGHLAAKLRARVVALEHRYYGDSHPFAEMTTSNLRYLNSAQALLDLRAFRLWYERTQMVHADGTPMVRADGKPHKWVVVGGSYAGNLAAWFRARFPSLAAAAHASSAPIHVMDDFPRFDVQLQAALATETGCVGRLRNAAAALNASLAGDADAALSAQAAKALFDADALSDDDFAYLHADAVAIAVQYGHKRDLCGRLSAASAAARAAAAGAAAASAYAAAWSAPAAAARAAAGEGNREEGVMLLRALASFTKAHFYPTLETGKPECYDRKYLANSAVATEKNARQWLFQQCTELGWFQVHPDGDASLRLPRVNRAYFRKLCADTFGAELHPDTESATANYEAAALNASHVFFTFGKDDPWQSAYPVHGRADAANGPFAAAPDAPGAKARHQRIECDECAHCVDLGQMSSGPAEVQAVRQAAASAICGWVHGAGAAWCGASVA